MSAENLNNEIKTIFAKACADSLVHSLGHVLSGKPEFRADKIEAAAELHAVACVKMMEAFVPSASPAVFFPLGMTFDEKSAWHSRQADKWRATAEEGQREDEIYQSVREGRFPNLQEAYRHFDSEQHQLRLAKASDGEALGEESSEAHPLPTPSHEPR